MSAAPPEDGAAADARAVSRARRRYAVRVLAAAAVLAALVLVLPLDELTGALRRLPWHAWPIALASYLTLHLVGTVKWRLLANAAGAGLPWRAAVRAYYYGLFGNLFLPSIVGGDVVRFGMAMRSARSATGLAMGSFTDRLLDVAGLMLLAGIGALLSPRALDGQSKGIFVSAGLLLLLGTIGGVLAARFVPVRRLPWTVRRRLVTVRRALRATARRPGALLTALLLGLVLQGSLVVMNWWLGVAIGIAVPLYVWLFVWPLAKIAALAPLTQGGIGVREAAQAALFAPFGVSAAMAVATGLVFQGVVIVGGLAGGAIALLLGGNGAGAADRPGTRASRGEEPAPALPR